MRSPHKRRQCVARCSAAWGYPVIADQRLEETTEWGQLSSWCGVTAVGCPVGHTAVRRDVTPSRWVGVHNGDGGAFWVDVNE